MALFDDYFRSIEQLLMQLTPQNPRYEELLNLEARLRENIEDTTRYENTPELRANRSKILHQLNNLALETTGQSFNEIVEKQKADFLRVRNPVQISQPSTVGIQDQKAMHPQSQNASYAEDIAANLGHPAWEGIGAIATIILGILGIVVAIIIALIEFNIIDIHSIAP